MLLVGGSGVGAGRRLLDVCVELGRELLMGVMHASLVGSLLELLGRQRAEGADLSWTLNGVEMSFCSRWRDGFGMGKQTDVVVSCSWTLELGLLVARCRWVSPAGGLDVGASAVGKADRDGAVGVNGKNGKRRWCGCWRRTGGRADGRCWPACLLPCVAVVLTVVARDGWWQGRAD
ncbi:hypothetical protein ACLOJK_009828 [Asimina triloba]